MAKKYKTTVYLGLDENGKQRNKTIRADSPEELHDLVVLEKDRIKNSLYLSTSEYIEEWCDRWLNEYKIPSGISTGTINQYKAAINYIQNAFKNRQFKDVNLSEFQLFINNLAKMNPNTGKPTAKRTLQSIIKVAGGVFKYARSNRVEVPYFIDSVLVPKNAPEEKRRALTEEEQQMIIDTPHRCQLPAMIMMFSGLRRGEMIPLTWADIDLDNAIISVNKTVDVQSGNAVLKYSAKSNNSIREVNIPPILVDYLKKYKKKHQDSFGLITEKVRGGYHTNSSFRKMWDSFLKELNIKYGYPGRNLSRYNPERIPMKIERFTPHYLRHTFATLLYFENIDVVTAKQLMGHADIQTTINIYTDLKNNRYSLSDSYKKKLENEYRVIPKEFTQ